MPQRFTRLTKVPAMPSRTPAARQRIDDRTGPIGPQGPPGPRGETGAPGAPGRDHSAEIAMLRNQVERIASDLQTQLIRIGQLQAQLDSIGQAFLVRR